MYNLYYLYNQFGIRQNQGQHQLSEMEKLKSTESHFEIPGKHNKI